MTRVFVTHAFDKWARKERLRDAALLASIDEADAGLVDANLKGCLVKLRVARPGAGKRDGYRTIVAYRTEDRAFFLYGFGKNERANVKEDEVEALEEYGSLLLSRTETQIVEEIEKAKIRELQR